MTPGHPCRRGAGNVPCGRITVGGPYSHGRDCRLCWLYAHDQAFRDHWSGGRAGTVAPGVVAPGVVAHRPSPPPPPPRPPCVREGAVLEFSRCRGEAGHVRDCDLHDRCVRGPVRKARVQVCAECPDYSPASPPPTFTPTPASLSQPTESPTVNWSYGVTTVPQRRDDLLPRTLASLKAAGFDAPHLFVDGCRDGSGSWEDEFGLDVTARGGPNLKTAGNWVCSLYELFYRAPEADYFAVFQDDFVTCLGLREYLERNPCPAPGYMNLYTFPKVQRIAPKNGSGGTVDGWFKSVRVAKGFSDAVGREVEFQVGLGAVALVFTREGVVDLLGSRELAGRPLDPERGHRSIDGGVVHCMNKMGYNEYCHSPSLVQHTGERSSMGNRKFPLAESFRGEFYNLMELLSGVK